MSKRYLADSFNDLKLFSQTGVDTDNIGIGNSALANNIGTDSIGIGKYALQNNTGHNSTGLGSNALRYNTGSNASGFGYAALNSNKGIGASGLGSNALRNNTGLYGTGFGYESLYNNIGNTSVGLGAFSLRNNIGINASGIGYTALVDNTGSNVSGFGYRVLANNVGANSTGFGYNNLQYNQKDNNTAIGTHSYSEFLDDTANNVTFDYTDIDVVTDRITITAHGLGAANDWVNIRYTQGTGSISGLTTTNIYQVMVIDVDTISFRELVSATNSIYHGTILYDAGTGTGHTLTPQFSYENVTVLGANSEPSKSNQVTLGDANVTEVVMGNGNVLGMIGTTAPISATDTGVVGEIRVTSTFIYTCIATDTWVRAAAATW